MKNITKYKLSNIKRTLENVNISIYGCDIEHVRKSLIKNKKDPHISGPCQKYTVQVTML